MHFVLIFTWMAGFGGTSFTAEFSDRLACHRAADAHIKTMQSNHRVNSNILFLWNCVEKGSTATP